MKYERYMVDTNILIYKAYDEDLLTPKVKAIFRDHNNQIYVPSKCVEELIYLKKTGRIKVKQWKSPRDITRYIGTELDWLIKYVAEEHLNALVRLPLFPKHKDHTDRIIAAQAIIEATPLISSDPKFHDYKRYGLTFIFNKL